MNKKGKNDGNLTERIRLLAKKNGTNIKSLEMRSGLSNGSIRRWETSMPTIDNLAAIAKELNVSIDNLYYGYSESDKEHSLLTYFRSLPKNIQDNCISYIHGLHDSYQSMQEHNNTDNNSDS